MHELSVEYEDDNVTEHGQTTKMNNAFTPNLLSRIREPESVAIVCASRIGDFLCATPAFRALRRRLPAARFTLIGLPFVREMVERNAHLDDFEPFPGFPGIAEQFFAARKTASFFQKMHQKNFDLAVQMHGSGVYSNIFTLMIGARYAAGFVRDVASAGRLAAAMPWPASLHAARRALALAVFLGADGCGEEMEFGLTARDHASAGMLLDGCRDPLVGLHPWSREQDKLWPTDRYIAAGSELVRRLRGTVLIIGGPAERGPGERLARAMGRECYNLAGRESLGEMAALISRLSVLITNDSGPAHIAYALGTPSVTLFGPTDPAEWGPPAHPRHRALRAPDRMLSSITVEEVVRAATEVAPFRNNHE